MAPEDTCMLHKSHRCTARGTSLIWHTRRPSSETRRAGLARARSSCIMPLPCMRARSCAPGVVVAWHAHGRHQKIPQLRDGVRPGRHQSVKGTVQPGSHPAALLARSSCHGIMTTLCAWTLSNSFALCSTSVAAFFESRLSVPCINMDTGPRCTNGFDMSTALVSHLPSPLEAPANSSTILRVTSAAGLPIAGPFSDSTHAKRYNVQRC